MIVAVPTAVVVTKPLLKPMSAVAGALLIHVPPVGLSLKEEVPPRQMARLPDTANGNGLTVRINVV